MILPRDISVWCALMLAIYPAIAWKVAWSYSGYRGWDLQAYREWLRGGLRGFKYVEEHGFGHEWWNFYEGFSKEYYYGYAPPLHFRKPKKLMKGGVIFFISRHPWMTSWFLAGIYGGVSVLEESPDIGPLLNLVPDEYRNEVAEDTKRELLKIGSDPDHTFYLLRAEKKFSTPMPKPMLLNLEDAIGVKRLGQALYKYLKKDMLLALLDKTIKSIEDLPEEEISTTSYWVRPKEALSRLKSLREHLAAPDKTYKASPTLLGQESAEKFHNVPESLIEDALFSNPEVLEGGLVAEARQVIIPDAGRVDLLMRDKNGTPIIIEIKSGLADDSALTQLLNYMSQVKGSRGIIVAEEFTRRLRQAVRILDNVKLVKVAVKLDIEKVEEIK